MRLAVRVPQVGSLAVLLLAWYIVAESGHVSTLILPKLDAVGHILPKVLLASHTYADLRVTLYEFLLAYGFALIVGMGAGFLLGAARYAGDVFEPLILALYAVPIIIFYPLCILVFGIGSASKVAFAGVYAFFPISINTLVGVRTVDPVILLTARSLGASRWQLVSKVILPSALPAIMSGLRLGMVLGLIGVIAGEMLAATQGIGYRVSWAAETFNIPYLYAYIILILLIIAVTNGLMSYLENRASYQG